MFYFTKSVAPTPVSFSKGVCYIKTKEIFGPYSSEAMLIAAMQEHVEEEKGNASAFEVFIGNAQGIRL